MSILMIEDWHPYIPTGNTSQSDDGHDVGSIRFPSSRFGRDVISFCEKGARVPFVPDGKFLLLRERKRWMQRGHGNASDGCLWPSMTMPLRLASNSKSNITMNARIQKRHGTIRKDGRKTFKSIAQHALGGLPSYLLVSSC